MIDGLWDDDPPVVGSSAGPHLRLRTASCLGRAGRATDRDLPGRLPPRLRTQRTVDVHRLLTSAGSDDPSVWEEALADSASAAAGRAGDRIRRAVAGPHRRRARPAARPGLGAPARRGRGAEVLPELRAAVGREPLREDRVLLLARALGEVGRARRRAAALSTATDAGSARSSAWTRRQRCRPCVRPCSPFLGPSTEVATPSPEARRRLPDDAEPLAGGAWPPARRRRHGDRRPGLALGRRSGARPGRRPHRAGAVSRWIRRSGSLSRLGRTARNPRPDRGDGDVVWVRSVEDQAVAVLDLGADGAAEVTGVAAPPSALALDNAAAVVGLGFSGETVTVSNGRVGPPTPAVEGRPVGSRWPGATAASGWPRSPARSMRRTAQRAGRGLSARRHTLSGSASTAPGRGSSPPNAPSSWRSTPATPQPCARRCEARRRPDHR